MVDHGYIDYPRILARPLPEEAPEAAKELYKGFVMLLGIRKLYNADQEATPFSWRFAAGWCGGLTNYKIKQGMAWLLGKGFLHKVGTTSSRTSLFALKPAREEVEPSADEPNRRDYTRTKTATEGRGACKENGVKVYATNFKKKLKMAHRKPGDGMNNPLRL